MTNKTKYHVKKHFCRCYLQCFSSSKVLKCHIKNVLVINHTKLVLLSGKDQYIDFQNFKRLRKAPLITYGNFKPVLISLSDNIHFGPNTKNYHDHVACSYGYKLICVDD